MVLIKGLMIDYKKSRMQLLELNTYYHCRRELLVPLQVLLQKHKLKNIKIHIKPKYFEHARNSCSLHTHTLVYHLQPRTTPTNTIPPETELHQIPLLLHKSQLYLV